MRNIEKAIEKIQLNPEKYRDLTRSLIQKKPKSPQWVEKNRPTLQKTLQRQMLIDLTELLQTQNPQILQDTASKPNLFKLMHQLTKNASVALIANIKLPANNDQSKENNEKFRNNQTTLFKKLIALLCEAYDVNATKADRKKKLRKLLKYLAILEARNAHADQTPEDPKQATEKNSTADKSIFQGAWNFLLSPNPKQLTAIQLKSCLGLLGLKAGAKPQEIKDAFQEMVKEFSQKINPRAEEQVQFDLATAAHQVLMANDAPRLENLAQEVQQELLNQPITPEELKLFAQTLQLKPDQSYSTREIEAKFIEYGAANVEKTDAQSQEKLMQVEHILEKLSARSIENNDQTMRFDSLLSPVNNLTPTPSLHFR